MKTHPYTLLYTLSLIFIGLLLTDCANQAKEYSDEKRLAEHKEELKTLQQKITALEQKIQAKETDRTVVRTPVSIQPMRQEPFSHMIEVRGSVRLDKQIVLRPEASGRVVKIHVSEGNKVKENQLLAQLDATLIQKQLQELKTNLSFAQTLFGKQQALWNKNIGTEIQYLEAENKVKSLEQRERTLQEQYQKTFIRAPFSGTIDEVYVKEGEWVAQGMVELMRLVSMQDLYIYAEVSDQYAGLLSVGNKVMAHTTTLDKQQIETTLSFVSQVLNTESRTFFVKAYLPKGKERMFRPNQVLVVHLEDYVKQKALSLPTYLVQRGEKGRYVYRIRQDTNKGAVAERVHVEVGKSYGGRTEIVQGLRIGDQVIDKGYKGVSEGSPVEVVTQVEDTDVNTAALDTE